MCDKLLDLKRFSSKAEQLMNTSSPNKDVKFSDIRRYMSLAVVVTSSIKELPTVKALLSPRGAYLIFGPKNGGGLLNRGD